MTIAIHSIENYLEIQTIIRSILVANAQNGSTVQEIREQYYELTGEKLTDIEDMTEFLLEIKGIMCFVNENGTRIFHIVSSDKSQHILSMVHNQKPSKHQNSRKNNENNNNLNENTKKTNNRVHHPSKFENIKLPSTNNIETDTSNSDINYCAPNNVCFFKNNYRYFQNQKHQNFADQMNSSWNSRQTGTSTALTNDNNYDQNFFENFFNEKGVAHLYDYQLMGDDFFLSMAKLELGCKTMKGHNSGSRSGLCVSGLTIRRATKLVNTLPYICPNIIVNIGSVDILNGRDLIDIEYDFRNLKRAFFKRGIKPIFTTLPPLGNFSHKSERHIIERFNDFILRNIDVNVIDLWPCMVSQQGHTLFECYQTTARYVTGSDQPHVLWNKLGRQRILKKIKSEIELLPF